MTANVRQGSLHLYIDDLFDGQPGTFAFGNPFSIRSVPQYTPYARSATGHDAVCLASLLNFNLSASLRIGSRAASDE
ncbi:hypothetical protein [Sphingomonas sp. ERG5]|uniref:hypothetical protein n=1 Tax=Sphingomonas sp. ERG5 TaxID=1381597 RepID=UPI001364E062|nr:hypothetical protein [Sphingomonas sp. ERG5]